MTKKSFVIINVIHSIIEYVLIYWILSLLIHRNGILFMVIALLFLLSLIFVYSQFNASKVFKGHTEKISDDMIQLINEVIKDVDGITKDDFLKINLSAIPSSAMYSDGKIYINEAYHMPQKNKEALIAHEVGHYISAKQRHHALSLGGIASIRPSVYLSRFYKSMRSKLIYSKKLKNRSVFDYLFSAPFYLLFLINDISLYRPMRNEEMIANDEAILMGYGDALRTYYYEISRRQIKKDLMDKEHPSIRKMIEKMNQTMGIDDPMLKDVYVRHGKVVYVDQYYSNASKREKEIKYWLNSEIQRVDVYHRLAFLYFNQGQCREDEKQLAIENYQKAIDLGDGLACYKLAQLYEKVGSFDLAINAYEKGVEMNDLNSILMLAEWYKKGIHIEKDLDSSYKMYLKGAELGNLLSIFYRDYINLSFKSYAYEYKGESFNYDKRLIEIMLDGTIKETIDDENGTQLNVHQYRKKGQMLYVYDSEKQYKRYVIVLKNQGLKIKHIQFEDNKFVDILFKKVEE